MVWLLDRLVQTPIDAQHSHTALWGALRQRPVLMAHGRHGLGPWLSPTASRVPVAASAAMLQCTQQRLPHLPLLLPTLTLLVPWVLLVTLCIPVLVHLGTSVLPEQALQLQRMLPVTDAQKATSVTAHIPEQVQEEPFPAFMALGRQQKELVLVLPALLVPTAASEEPVPRNFAHQGPTALLAPQHQHRVLQVPSVPLLVAAACRHALDALQACTVRYQGAV